MYLHYYLNEKYIGAVDIEVFMDSRQPKTLITCSPECDLLIGSLELIYGKTLERFNQAEAWDLKHHVKGMQQKHRNYVGLPQHIYTTKRVGKVLQWSELERALCV